MRLRRKTNYTAAIYLRISRDDGDKVESDSIQNQRELINEYLKNIRRSQRQGSLWTTDTADQTLSVRHLFA